MHSDSWCTATYPEPNGVMHQIHLKVKFNIANAKLLSVLQNASSITALSEEFQKRSREVPAGVLVQSSI